MEMMLWDGTIREELSAIQSGMSTALCRLIAAIEPKTNR